MGVSLRRTLGSIALISGVALSLSGEVVAQPRNAAAADSRPPAHVLKGREIEAPPWSFACMTDHGPRPCNEPMWVYE